MNGKFNTINCNTFSQLSFSDDNMAIKSKADVFSNSVYNANLKIESMYYNKKQDKHKLLKEEILKSDRFSNIKINKDISNFERRSTRFGKSKFNSNVLEKMVENNISKKHAIVNILSGDSKYLNSLPILQNKIFKFNDKEAKEEDETNILKKITNKSVSSRKVRISKEELTNNFINKILPKKLVSLYKDNNKLAYYIPTAELPKRKIKEIIKNDKLFLTGCTLSSKLNDFERKKSKKLSTIKPSKFSTVNLLKESKKSFETLEVDKTIIPYKEDLIEDTILKSKKMSIKSRKAFSISSIKNLESTCIDLHKSSNEMNATLENNIKSMRSTISETKTRLFPPKQEDLLKLLKPNEFSIFGSDKLMIKYKSGKFALDTHYITEIKEQLAYDTRRILKERIFRMDYLNDNFEKEEIKKQKIKKIKKFKFVKELVTKTDDQNKKVLDELDKYLKTRK